MNILGIGAPELILIIMIMLVIAGPKRMMQWAYLLGKYMAKLRLMWAQTMDIVQQELNAAGVDIELPKQPPTRAGIRNSVTKAMQPVIKPMEQAMTEVKTEFEETKRAADIPAINPLGADTENNPKLELGAWVKATKSNEPPLAGNAAKTDETPFGTWSSRNGKSNE